MLALLGQNGGGVELGAEFGGFLGLPIIVAPPARDGRDDEHRERDEIGAVAVPQLLELLASDFLIDFLKNIAHGEPFTHWSGFRSPETAQAIGCYTLSPTAAPGKSGKRSKTAPTEGFPIEASKIEIWRGRGKSRVSACLKCRSYTLFLSG